MADKKPTLQEMQEELAAVQLETAKIGLERAREDNAKWVGEREVKSRQNRDRMAQLQAEVNGRELTTRQCKHRQGGTPKNPFGGKGATSLKVVRMPDGFTKMIMCSVCRLRLFSPHPRDGAQGLRKGETEAQRDRRIAKYEAAEKRFQELYERSQTETLTDEAAQEMDCGTTITMTDALTGNPVLPKRPCDSYLQPTV